MPASSTRRSNRIVLLSLLACLPVAGACAGSGSGSAAPPEPDPAAEFTGAWSGTFEAERFGGFMTMELQLEDGTYLLFEWATGKLLRRDYGDGDTEQY